MFAWIENARITINAGIVLEEEDASTIPANLVPLNAGANRIVTLLSKKLAI